MLPQKPDDQAVEQARELDSQIRQLAHHAHVVIEALYALVAQAKATNIHVTLGFPSWPAYVADALDGQWKITKDKRGEVVRFLAAQGMSQRAISRITGVGKGTVGRELAGAPLGQVIGLDGKTYTRPEPQVPHDGPPDDESDEEFLARLRAEGEARNAGRRVIRIPDTVEELRQSAERITAEQRRVVRIMFDMAFAAVEKLPTTAAKNAWRFGLQLNWLQTNTVWCLDDGLAIEDIAERSGASVSLVEEWLDDYHSGSTADYVTRIITEATEELEAAK